MTAQHSMERTSINWGYLLLAMALPLVGTYSWLNFSPVLPIIGEEFAVDNTSLAMLTSATVLPQFALQMPAGYLIDRIGDKWGISLGALVIGIGVIGSAVAPNFAILVACRALLGIGLAPAFVAGLTLARSFAPRSKSVMVQGFYGSFGSMGMLMALLTAERLTSLITWRGLFLIAGLVVLLVAFLQATFLPPSKKMIVSNKRYWMNTFRQKPLYLLGIAMALTYGTFTTLVAWVATFLIRQHGASIEVAGPLAAIMAFTAVITRLTSGPVVKGRERLIVVGTAFGTAVLVALLPMMPDLTLAFVMMIIIGWTANVSFGATFSYSSLLSDSDASGMDLGLINIVANIGAFVFPLLVGWGLDTTGTFTVAFPLVAVVGIIGALTVAVWLPHLRRERQRA